MYINEYALEVMTKIKLAELRADAARYRAVASLRTPRPGVWVALRSMLHREGPQSNGRKIARPSPGRATPERAAVFIRR
jgi:hypothetical protein